MEYEIKQRFISMNRSNQLLNAIGTVVHETADPGATDENEFNYFNSGRRGASAHAFVDYDSITQTIPWYEQAWHAGPIANRTRIGIELCHYDDESRFKEVWNRGVWLFAWVHVNIIKQTTITTDNLMSHAEVTQRWHESTHMDPISYFAEFGKTVDDFRRDVQAMINSMTGDTGAVTIPTTDSPTPSQPEPSPGPSVDSGVLQLQRTLNRLQIRDNRGSSLAEDGIQGRRTTEAIRRLQSICGISVDGIAGPQTFGAINSILAKPLIRSGSRGIPVRYVQYRVGVSNDGIFGPNTRNAVIRYQSSNGLSADGIVGPRTWASLIG